MTLLDVAADAAGSTDTRISYYGVHHLALNTEEMKMTVDFYVGVLGMRLVHAMRVPPCIGTGPGNRGNPPFDRSSNPPEKRARPIRNGTIRLRAETFSRRGTGPPLHTGT